MIGWKNQDVSDIPLDMLGIDIIVADHMFPRGLYQFRFPKSKRKRIRKKWRKNLDNWRLKPLESQYIVIDDRLVTNSIGYATLRKRLKSFPKNEIMGLEEPEDPKKKEKDIKFKPIKVSIEDLQSASNLVEKLQDSLNTSILRQMDEFLIRSFSNE